MSKFLKLDKIAKEGREIQFSEITEKSLNVFEDANNKLVGFRILKLDDYYVSEIFDSTTGDDDLIASVSFEPWFDLAGGLFATACVASANPLIDKDAKFYLVDY